MVSRDASGLTIQAKRIAFDGTPIDREPILLAHEDGHYLDSSEWEPPSIAFDGTNFLVVWTTLSGDIHGTRVSSAGYPLDPQPIAITAYKPNWGSARSIRVIWSGETFVVVWMFLSSSSTFISLPRIGSVSIVRVSAGGHVLDTAPSVIWQQAPVAGDLAVAANGSELLAIWALQDCLWTATLHNDGSPLDAARLLRCQGSYSGFDLAWNGGEFVAVWGDPTAHTVNALRIDPAMKALDAAPFAVNPPGTSAEQPSVVASGGGATIAYIRVADEPQYGGVPRAFARTLPPLNPAPRPRAIRF